MWCSHLRGFRYPRRYLEIKNEGNAFFETLGTGYLAMLCHILEDQLSKTQNFNEAAAAFFYLCDRCADGPKDKCVQYIKPGPYLGILRPWAQENFAPPPICSYSVMCKQKQHQKLTKDKIL
jgi:hypothetical protein